MFLPLSIDNQQIAKKLANDQKQEGLMLISASEFEAIKATLVFDFLFSI